MMRFLKNWSVFKVTTTYVPNDMLVRGPWLLPSSRGIGRRSGSGRVPFNVQQLPYHFKTSWANILHSVRISLKIIPKMSIYHPPALVQKIAAAKETTGHYLKQ